MTDNIVLDTNIIISILITPSGKTASLFYALIKKKKLFTADFAIEELIKHTSKIQKLTGYSFLELERLQLSLFSAIHVISRNIIPEEHIINALQLCKDVDIKDSPFIAAAFMVNGNLWTGDKKLTTYLRSKQFTGIYTADDIENLLQL